MAQYIRIDEYEDWVQNATRLVSVRLTVENRALDGSVTIVPEDLSAAGIVVEFRVSPGGGAPAVDCFVLDPVTDGSDGEFAGEAKLTTVDNGQEGGIYVIDENTPDVDTLSLFQETIWESQWQLNVYDPMEVE